MYSSADHWMMMADHVRGAAYAEALRRLVRPGSVVVDIGTGTGAFALQAARLGADRVYAIEYDDSIQVARALAAANGLGDNIEFMQAFSTDVKLPQRADVIVSDLRGVLPLHAHHIPAIADAADRFLAPGGDLIPTRDVIWGSVIDVPELYRRLVVPWTWHTAELDYEPARLMAVNRWSKVHVKPEHLLAEAVRWTTLEYSEVRTPNVQGEMTWTIARPGQAHGLCLWFETTLTEGVGFSSAPGRAELIYGQGFFPLASPQTVEPGDVVSVQLAANLIGNDYVWRWSTQVRSRNDAKPRVQFEQSNFAASPLTSDSLRKEKFYGMPTLSEDGHIDRAILELMDGHMTLAVIAERIQARFPERFSRGQDALRRVQGVSRRYSE